MSKINNLPNDVLDNISKFAVPKNIANLRSTSSKFQDVEFSFPISEVLKYLRLAIINNKVDIVISILSDGRYDEEIRNKFQDANIHRTIMRDVIINMNDDPEIINYFVNNKGANLNFSDKITGDTAVHLAVKYNKPNILISLLKDYKIPVDGVKNRTFTPLVNALSQNTTHLDNVDQRNNIVKILIHYGANVNYLHENSNITPLSTALGNSNNIEGIRLLLEKGAFVNSQYGVTKVSPLHQCINYNTTNPLAIVELLNYGAKLDSVDYEFNTPLHKAVQRSKLSVVKILVHRIIDKKQYSLFFSKNKSGKIPLDMVSEENKKYIEAVMIVFS